MNKQENQKKHKTKTRTPKQPKPLTPMDILKLEIANELGLMDKVKQEGWAGLTAAETGRIGGLMTARIKKGKLEKTL